MVGEIERVAKVAVTYRGALLMGRRRDSGKWTEPGGHLDPGEDPVAGVVRELREETGIDAAPKALKHLTTKRVTKPDGKKLVVYVYHVEAKEKPATTMKEDPDAEVHRWQWVNVAAGLPKDIAENLHVPLERNCLLKAMDLDHRKHFWRGFIKADLGVLGPGSALHRTGT